MSNSTERETVDCANANAIATSPTPPTPELTDPSILKVLDTLAKDAAMLDYDMDMQFMGGFGENSYGTVLQVKLIPKRILATVAPVPPLHCVLKIAPTNAARRAHMRVVDYYQREIFIYQKVITQFNELFDTSQRNGHIPTDVRLDITPKMFHSSLVPEHELIILEDLTLAGYQRNARNQMPTYDLVINTIEALAQFHAMSFVLQAKRPEIFHSLLAGLSVDNLFTPDIEPVSIEFGKKYVRLTRQMFESVEPANTSRDEILVLQQIENHFKEICLKCVNGAACAPYAVICHGDFWNNNILYKYNANNEVISAKLIDFQMSRYASPTLDILHYLFVCTEKELRDKHFAKFLESYYHTLAKYIGYFSLDPNFIYPRDIFEQQLRDFGVFGYCMAAFSIPFFISNTDELPDIDTVSEAVIDLGNSNNNTNTNTNNNTAQQNLSAEHDATIDKCRSLVDKYNILTERTLPIFRRRMTGVVIDLIKYNMIDHLLQL